VINLPGAICSRCMPVVEGLVVAEVRDQAAAHLLRSADFELPSVDAVQEFLSIHGWMPEIVAGGAMRLHMDGRTHDAYGLLDQAVQAVPERAGWFATEAAGLRVMDGDVGRALDLLETAGPDAHPCWHLHHGLLARSLGRKEAALDHWRVQVDEHPDEPLGWRALGWALIDADADANEVGTLMQEAAKHFPGTMEFRAWQGLAHYKQGDLSGGLAHLEASRDLEPLDPGFPDEVEQLVARVRAEQPGES
jgi:tetratricopeptide (TPR) repeat protein